MSGQPAWRMTRLGIGRSFQRTDLLRSLTVLENVRLAAQAAVRLPAIKMLRSAASETAIIKAARRHSSALALRTPRAVLPGSCLTENSVSSKSP